MTDNRPTSLFEPVIKKNNEKPINVKVTPTISKNRFSNQQNVGLNSNQNQNQNQNGSSYSSIYASTNSSKSSNRPHMKPAKPSDFTNTSSKNNTTTTKTNKKKSLNKSKKGKNSERSENIKPKTPISNSSDDYDLAHISILNAPIVGEKDDEMLNMRSDSLDSLKVLLNATRTLQEAINSEIINVESSYDFIFKTVTQERQEQNAYIANLEERLNAVEQQLKHEQETRRNVEQALVIAKEEGSQLLMKLSEVLGVETPTNQPDYTRVQSPGTRSFSGTGKAFLPSTISMNKAIYENQSDSVLENAQNMIKSFNSQSQHLEKQHQMILRQLSVDDNSKAESSDLIDLVNAHEDASVAELAEIIENMKNDVLSSNSNTNSTSNLNLTSEFSTDSVVDEDLEKNVDVEKVTEGNVSVVDLLPAEFGPTIFQALQLRKQREDAERWESEERVTSKIVSEEENIQLLETKVKTLESQFSSDILQESELPTSPKEFDDVEISIETPNTNDLDYN
eukprot:TRINITY_DN946_c0_g1_i1.p1 TRINITY_DN946_c0_g1~~TRINITY_DN946_c0_g1_i1.p1  ORF type:complete len:519 (+),score=167.94 TRINITY_DN946_c0_g1_i1:36-1559(+)